MSIDDTRITAQPTNRRHARERHRAAHRMAAGLLLQQTIEDGLDARGELGPTDQIRVIDDGEGNLAAILERR